MLAGRKSHALLALATFVACGSASAYDLIPLWEARLVDARGEHDSFYTTYFNDHRLAVKLGGFAEHGVAAWLPCSSDLLGGPDGEMPYIGWRIDGEASYADFVVHDSTRIPAHGYPTPWMNFDCRQPPGSMPLYRLHDERGSDHVYTMSTAEARALLARGYTFERVEGYVFTAATNGAVPLYRLRYAHSAIDTEHRYTISVSVRQGLTDAGWTDEGIAGYVYAAYVNPHLNESGPADVFDGYAIPDFGAQSIRNVTPATQRVAFGGSLPGPSSTEFVSNVTVRPAGAVWQRITFDFYSGDLFDAGSALDHIPVYLHYASTATTNELSYLPPYDGIAMVIAKAAPVGSPYNCGAPTSGGQIFIELGAARNFLCASNLKTPMQSRTWYRISYALGDWANVKVSVADAKGVPLKFLDGATAFARAFAGYYACPLFGPYAPDQSYCANPFSFDGFPVNNTGFAMRPLFWTPAPDFTARIANFKAQWLDASENVVR
jgi:hypothetical protein